MPQIEAETEQRLADTLQRITGLLLRRRWWIIAPACAIAIAVALVVIRLPNRYTSEATILVVQQQVPERYVTPTATTDIGRILQAMTQEVLSRPRLLGVIEELGLYPEQRNRRAPEELVALMREDVSMTPVQSTTDRREITALKISFVAPAPALAQQVTTRLSTLFIEQNLKTRADQALSTTRFLADQLEGARQKLAEHEQRLRDFKMQHLGELPEQQQGNLGILTGLQTQLTNIMGNLNRARQQRLYLESLVAEYERLGARQGNMAVPGGDRTQEPSPAEAASRELRRLQAERRALVTIYTPRHPSVLTKEKEISLQLQAVERLENSEAAPGEKSERRPDTLPPNGRDDAVVAQMKSQLEANRLEIEDLTKAEKQLKEEVDRYQTRLNLTPVREQQLTAILRDYELTRQHYADLLKKESESQLATDLEKKQEGQHFRIADPPNLPVRPSSPKRLMLSFSGAVAGLVFGLALAVFMEFRDTSFRQEKEIARAYALPVVVGIPALLLPAELRRRKWRAAAEWLCASVLSCAVVAAEVYVYWKR